MIMEIFFCGTIMYMYIQCVVTSELVRKVQRLETNLELKNNEQNVPEPPKYEEKLLRQQSDEKIKIE